MKTKLFLVVLLVLLGVWMGINFAKGRPLFSNPFADEDLIEKADRAASNLVEKSRETIDRTLKSD